MCDIKEKPRAGETRGSENTLLGNKIDAENSDPERDEQVAVMLGGYRIGHVRPRWATFEAVTAEHESLGRFNSAHAAARAILEEFKRVGVRHAIAAR